MGALRMPHLPAVPHFPPLWRESRFGLELAELRRSPVFRGHGVPDGDGRAVMLIPGFLAGDGSLATMTHWLRQNGYHTRRAGIRANVGCSEEACARLEARLEGFAEHTGQKVSIVGQSRGGIFARALAVRRPDLVEGIVTLGSPTVSQLRIHPLVLAQVGLVSALGTARIPGLFRLTLPARRLLPGVPRLDHRPVPRRRRLRRDVLALGRRRRLALLPGRGRRSWSRSAPRTAGCRSARRSTARSASRSAPSRAADADWAQAA